MHIMQPAVTIRNGREQCHFDNMGAWWPWVLTLITLNVQSDYNTLGCAVDGLYLVWFFKIGKAIQYCIKLRSLSWSLLKHLDSILIEGSKIILDWTLNVVDINQHCRVSWVDMIYL